MRRRRRRIRIGLVVLLLLVAAGIAANYLRSARQAATTAMPAPPADLVTPAQALRAMPAPALVAMAHRAAFGTDGVAAVPGEKGGELRFAPGELVWTGDMAVLLSPGTNADDCHACAGAVAVTYLQPRGGGFVVRGKWLDTIGGNGFGQPPTSWSVRTDMAPVPVVVATTGFSNQGYTCGVTTLTALTPAGPVQSDPVPTSYSNAGAVDPDSGRTMAGEPARDLAGEIVDVGADGFAVKAAGTTERYLRRGARFVRDGSPSAMDCGGA